MSNNSSSHLQSLPLNIQIQGVVVAQDSNRAGGGEDHSYDTTTNSPQYEAGSHDEINNVGGR